MHNSETPASVYAVLEGNKTVPLVADNLFDLLMLKMSEFYQPKKQTKIESRGPRFEAGDFLVKLGSVTMGPVFKGILIEVLVSLLFDNTQKEKQSRPTLFHSRTENVRCSFYGVEIAMPPR